MRKSLRTVLFASLLSSGCLLVTGLLSKDCGDGFVDAQEECDDGNTLFGDGCDAACQLELTEVTVADINDAKVNNARFAIFSAKVFPVDITIPPDGVIDLDLSGLQLIISDKEDLCEQLAADPAALQNLPDLEAVQVQLFRRAPIGASEFISGESLTSNDGLVNAVFGARVDSIFAGATIFVRSGGVDLVVANNPVFAINDGIFEVESLTADKLDAQLRVTLTAERVAEPFDLDEDPFDADLTPTLRTIAVPLAVTVRNISLCPSL